MREFKVTNCRHLKRFYASRVWNFCEFYFIKSVETKFKVSESVSRIHLQFPQSLALEVDSSEKSFYFRRTSRLLVWSHDGSLFVLFEPLSHISLMWVLVSPSPLHSSHRSEGVCRINSWKNKAKLSIYVVKQFLCHRKGESFDFRAILVSFFIPLRHWVTINWLCLCFYLRPKPANNATKH